MTEGLLQLFQKNVLNPIFAIGYANIHEMMAGAELYGFRMKIFRDALQQHDLTERMRLLRNDDWIPGDGDYIGGLHYRYAQEKLQHLYLDTLDGNDLLRGKALFLCHTISTQPPVGFPDDLAARPIHLGLIAPSPGKKLSIEQEHLLELEQFLSLFARVCRWESRNQGSLEQFLSRASRIVGDEKTLERALGYLLHMGKDILGFYLMLWEAVLITDYDDCNRCKIIEPARQQQL